jgi:hypothetical protein
MDEDWDHSHQSKEQIEASLMMKQEAALRRERGLAYAFSHQASSLLWFPLMACTYIVSSLFLLTVIVLFCSAYVVVFIIIYLNF